MTAPKEPFYDERISSLMSQIIELCKEAKINMAAQFSLGDDPDNDDQTLFCTTVIASVDETDGRGVERMLALRRIMYPPSEIFAFTIVGGKDGV